MHNLLSSSLLLLVLAGTPLSAQPAAERPMQRAPGGQDQRDERPAPPDDQPRAIDPATDPVLVALKAIITPTPEQWKSIQERYASFRQSQHDAMQKGRRSIIGQPPEGAQRPPRPTPEQRGAMDAYVRDNVEPLGQKFLDDVRAGLNEEQKTRFDAASKALNLMPPRGPGAASGQDGPGGPDGPGARAPRQGNKPSGPLPAHQVSIEIKDGYRVITSNGVPEHPTGKFPGRGNPNTIAAQSYSFRVPLSPKVSDTPSPQRGALAGVALNGIVFDPGTAENWKDDPSTGWRIEAIAPKAPNHMDLGLDMNNAHVQPNGAYHYHASPRGLVEEVTKASGQTHGASMILVGWAADGFPIYDHTGYAKADDAKSELKELRSSYQLKTEARPGGSEGPGGKPDGTYTRDYQFVPGSGDLDECNGRTGVTPEFPGGTYYYVITGEFPYIPRMFRGTPDPSFAKHDGPPGGGPGGRPRGGPGGGPAGNDRQRPPGRE